MMRTLRSFRTFTCRCVFHTVVFTTLTSVKESEHILFRILVFHINHVWFISRPLRGSRDKQEEKLCEVTTPLWGFLTVEIHNLKERKRALLLFHQRLSVMSLKTSDLCEGMLDVVTVASRRRRRGSSISPVSQRQRKDTGCGLLNAGRPPLYCLDNMGDIWQRCWGLHPLSGAVSCAALKHCLHILMLIREKAAADVKHLVLFLCTCKEIMWPPLSSFHCFCSPACHKKKGSLRWRPSSLVASTTSAACGRRQWRRNGLRGVWDRLKRVGVEKLEATQQTNIVQVRQKLPRLR